MNPPSLPAVDPLPRARSAGALVLLAAAAGTAVSALPSPALAAAAAAGALAVLLFFLFPAAAPWAWLLISPLVVGIARGGDSGLLRPNELLLLGMCAGVALGLVHRAWHGERVFPRLSPVDFAMLALTITGSAVPLLLRFGRGLPVSPDDVLYAMVMAKYLALYAVFRLSVRDASAVAICLRLILAAGAIVAFIALLQAGDISAVNDFLSRYYDSPFEGSNGATSMRASSTVASAFGLADMMSMCLALVVALIMGGGPSPAAMLAIGALFLAGCLATGSFSGLIGCTVAVAVVGLSHRRFLRIAALALPAALASGLLLWPVIANRLSGFAGRVPLPHSWLGRLENLERFFWPELFSGANWITGVRPAARVAAPEAWRDWVYIESGYTWLLWTGGIALLLAFLVFVAIAGRALWQATRSGAGPSAPAATAALGALAMITVLMLFDPHLTVRGSADLFFPLVALALAETTWRPTADPRAAR